MKETKRLFKVLLALLNIGYVVCVVGFILFPETAKYLTGVAFHGLASEINPINSSSFIVGLVFWNVLFSLGFWLFVKLNRLFKS